MSETVFKDNENVKAFLIVKDAEGNERELPCDWLGVEAQFDEPVKLTFRVHVSDVVARDENGTEFRPFKHFEGVSVESSARPRSALDSRLPFGM